MSAPKHVFDEGMHSCLLQNVCSKGYAFVSAPKHVCDEGMHSCLLQNMCDEGMHSCLLQKVCDELLKLNEVKFYGSNQN